MQARLNPLTTARVVDGPDGRVFQLRSFTPGRSFIATWVSEAEAPAAYAVIARWLETGEEGVPSDRLTVAQWLKDGLLVPSEILAKMPAGPGPGVERGPALADALLPGIAQADWTPAPPMPGMDPVLVEEGYGLLPSLFEAEQRNLLRQWYATLFDGGWAREEGRHGSRRVVHSDPIGRAVMERLAPFVSALAGTPLEPSYCFAAEYQPGNALAVHTDREQCEYTVSLFIEHVPGGGEAACPWPIAIRTPTGDVVMYQPPCGGPIFRGRELPHYRAALGEGERSRHLFLHFVPEGFDGPRE